MNRSAYAFSDPSDPSVQYQRDVPTHCHQPPTGPMDAKGWKAVPDERASSPVFRNERGNLAEMASAHMQLYQKTSVVSM